MLTLNKLVFTFGVLIHLCQFWWKSIKKCERESLSTDGYTGRRKPIL